MNQTLKSKRAKWVAVAGVSSVLLAAGIANATTRWISRPLANYPIRHLSIGPVGLSVLDRAPSAADQAGARDPNIVRAVQVLTSDDPGVPESFLAGQANAGGLRIAMSHLGTGDHSIFLVRTSKGRICEGLTQFSSGCLEGLPPDVAVTATAADPDGDNRGEAPLVWGIARNEVKSVDVIVQGQAHPATLANNAYFYELPNNTMLASDITDVVAHLAGGNSVDTPVVTGPAPGVQVTTTTTP